jgi:hypothetical protein
MKCVLHGGTHLKNSSSGSLETKYEGCSAKTENDFFVLCSDVLRELLFMVDGSTDSCQCLQLEVAACLVVLVL